MKPRDLARSLIVALLGWAVLAGPLAAAPPPQATARGAAGQPGPSAAGAPTNPHTLPSGPPASASGREVPRHYPVDQAAFGRLKAQANAAGGGAGGPPGQGGGTPPAPDFPTLGYTDGSNGGSVWNPPDGALAVGPASILVGVNQAFGFYDRNGNRLFGPISFNTFFGIDGSTSTYDPRALFDAGNGKVTSGAYGGGSGRFVLLATTGDLYTLAVSQNDHPQSASTGWCVYKLNAVISSTSGPTYADFPGLGIDGDNLYLTSDQYSSDGIVHTARLLVVPKSSVYPNATTGACPTASSTDFRDLQNPGGGAAMSVQPANQPDALPGQTSVMYLVNAIWTDGSNLVVRSVVTKPSLALRSANWVSSGFIAPYNLSADAPQPGGPTLIDTGDTRLPGASYRYGRIYTANTTRSVSSRLSGAANRYANAQWYEITPDPSDPTKSTGASHVIASPSVAFYFPAVLPGCSGTVSTDANGLTSCSTSPSVALEVSGSGSHQAASAFSVQGGSPTAYAQGVAGYTLNTRWGDYPAVAADPTSAAKVWLLGEYARASNAWGTAVVSITP